MMHYLTRNPTNATYHTSSSLAKQATQRASIYSLSLTYLVTIDFTM